MTFYLPLWGAIIFNGVTYFQVIRMLNNATRVWTQTLCPSILFLSGWCIFPESSIARWKILAELTIN
jgi:hypothetical protein